MLLECTYKLVAIIIKQRLVIISERFFLGDSRPGAFVVADMCVNLLVELAFGAVLSPEMG